jgi:hypothetical protein
VRLVNGSGKRADRRGAAAQCGGRREAHRLNFRQARPQRTPEHGLPVAAVLDYLGAASRCDADHAAQSDPSGGLRPVQPPRLLHASRVRQPSFRTMNRLWPSARHSSAGHRSPSPCETPRQRRRTSGAKLVIDISARRSCLLGLDSNRQADGGCFWRRQPLLTWQLPPG